MRAISLNRQTGVLPHGFSRLEYLAQARSPPKSTQGSASPLLFGQDLVKVSASHFEPATFALATNPSGMHEPSGCSPNRHDPAISLGSAASTESLSRYPGVSPFPLAPLDYQLGLMWMNEGRLEDARAARRLVLAFAAAQGHLAEAEAEAGACDSAVARLRTLATDSCVSRPVWQSAAVADYTPPAQRLEALPRTRQREEDARTWSTRERKHPRAGSCPPSRLPR